VCDRVGHRHGQWPSSPRFPPLRTCGVVVGARRRPVDTTTSLRLTAWPYGRALPARLGDAGQFAAVRRLPEAHPAQPELAEDGSRPAAARASAVGPDLELRLTRRLGDQRLLRHALFPTRP